MRFGRKTFSPVRNIFWLMAELDCLELDVRQQRERASYPPPAFWESSLRSIEGHRQRYRRDLKRAAAWEYERIRPARMARAA